MIRPVRFQGTDAEARANYATHVFIYDEDGDTRCADCDARPTHAAASYPCGTRVPSETVEVAG
jgi:hypothetical protein